MDIQNLIIQGRAMEVMEMLSKNASSSDENFLLNLQSQWYQNERSNRMGTIDHSTYNRIRNRINHSVLEMAEYSNTTPKSNTSVVQNQTGVSSKINILKSLQPKVRFGFSKELKTNLGSLLDELLSYEASKRRDGLFDVDERIIEGLVVRFNQFVNDHQRELRVKNNVKIADLKQQLLKLEEDLTIAGLKSIVDNLIALDANYSRLKDSLRSVSEINKENFAIQVAEIIDNL